MKNKALLYYLLAFLGVVLFLTGGFLLKGVEEKNISALCIGIGAGLFGMSVGSLVSIRVDKKHPDIQRRKSIEVNDERNITIRDKAGAKTNQIMNYVLCILTLTFTLMNVSMYITLLMVTAILIRAVLVVAYTNKYNKEL